MRTYLRHKSVNIVDVKELVALEFLDFEGKYKDYEEKHEFWELCYVKNGRVTLFLENESFVLNERELFFIPPGELHSYKSDNSNNNEIFVVCFECSYTGLKLMGRNRFLLDDENVGCVEKLIYEAENTFCINENDVMELLLLPVIGGQQVIIMLLEYLIIRLLRELASEKTPQVVFLSDESFYSEITGIIIKYLDDNIGSKLALSDVCRKVNYSAAFVCKNFKKQMGVSLFTYFNRMKMERAEKYLAETSMSAKDIARELGFSDAKYFGEMFKKHTGKTPLMYRKEYKKRGE